MRKIGALEAGGTKMVLGIFNEQGGELARQTLPTLTPQETIPAMQAFFDEHGIAALGIGAFGPLDLSPLVAYFGLVLLRGLLLSLLR